MGEYLTPSEVSERYKGSISVKTLANWRAKKKGPKWTKIGGRILYRVDHVLSWENGRTSDIGRLILLCLFKGQLLARPVADFIIV